MVVYIWYMCRQEEDQRKGVSSQQQKTPGATSVVNKKKICERKKVKQSANYQLWKEDAADDTEEKSKRIDASRFIIPDGKQLQ